MNKIAKTITKISAIMVLALSFTACQDPIFFYINQEVKLEEATILGDIFTIVRFNAYGDEKLYIANGNIYSKNADNATHGSWIKLPAPAGHVHSLAADQNYLYAFAYQHTADTGSGETELTSRKIYYSPDCGESWYEHPINSYISQTSFNQEVILMSTNAPQQAHRKAFIRIDGILYNLNGASYSSRGGSGAKSCVWWGSDALFFNSFGACSDETSSSNATRIYFADGYYLRYTTDGNSTSTRITDAVRSEIKALAVMNGSVLVSTTAGTAIVDWNTGSEINFTNLTSTVSALYENHAVIAVYPEKTYSENILYASNQVYGTGSNSALFTHEGLWSYYPSRGTWNIE